MHFLVNDYGLRHHHEEVYDRTGRWILAVAIIGGWSLGNIFSLHEAVLGALFAFIAGAIIFNVLKEELPEERESRYRAFALGATVYAAALILI